jgi:hypothetical protein
MSQTAGSPGLVMSNLQLPFNPCVLPVSFLNFSASVKFRRVHLSWTTAEEINNDYFVIERSTDGVDYEKIGVVEGSGTSSGLYQYSFTDYSPLENTS